MTKNPFQRQQQLQAEIKPPDERPNPYLRLYGLRENPFPTQALFSPTIDDPRCDGRIYDEAFRWEEEKRFFELFVQPPTGDRPISLGFIRLDPQAGGRGNGKSVFLHHVAEQINKQGWPADWPTDPDSTDLFALAVHILPEPRRQRRFWQFIHLIFETCASEGLFPEIDEQFRASILLRLLTEAQIVELASRPSNEISALLRVDDGFRGFLDEQDITQQEFNAEAEHQLRQVGEATLSYGREGFLSQFSAVNFSLTKLWAAWQQGGVVGHAYRWRNVGARWFTDGLVPVLIVAGYRRFYLLLDEFEKIYVSQNGREREEFLDSLRQYFYERDSTAVRYQYVSTVLTVHPSIDRYLADHWVRVGLENIAPLDPGRIRQRSVILGPSDVNKLSHLLAEYIDYFRQEPDDKHRETLYPFADDALEPAMEAARFYPRGTLWYAYELIRKAAEEEVVPPITRRFVEEFIEAGYKPPVDSEDALFELPPSTSDLQA